MATSQLIAIGIASILRFGFGAALLIISKPYSTPISTISNWIAFASVCFYMMKIKLCPDMKNHFLLTVIETSIGIVIVEFLMGLWSNMECLLSKISATAFRDILEAYEINLITDTVIMSLAACILMTVLVEAEVFQKIVNYYKKMRTNPCPPPKFNPKASSTPYRANLNQPDLCYRNPQCPLHGDAVGCCR